MAHCNVSGDSAAGRGGALSLIISATNWLRPCPGAAGVTEERELDRKTQTVRFAARSGPYESRAPGMGAR
jgi:hypothetical protein